jgi:hypothetical protein
MFKEYRRKGTALMRPVTSQDTLKVVLADNVSISNEDLILGSPKIGDMIAINKDNHSDRWLVAEQYFKDNFEIKVV